MVLLPPETMVARLLNCLVLSLHRFVSETTLKAVFIHERRPLCFMLSSSLDPVELVSRQKTKSLISTLAIFTNDIYTMCAWLARDALGNVYWVCN